MNKVKKWLIHKLGGVAEIPLSPPNVHYITHDLSPVKFSYSHIVPEHIPPSIVEESIAERLGKEMLNKGFIEVRLTKLDLPNGTNIEYEAEVYAVKKEIIQ